MRYSWFFCSHILKGMFIIVTCTGTYKISRFTVNTTESLVLTPIKKVCDKGWDPPPTVLYSITILYLVTLGLSSEKIQCWDIRHTSPLGGSLRTGVVANNDNDMFLDTRGWLRFLKSSPLSWSFLPSSGAWWDDYLHLAHKSTLTELVTKLPVKVFEGILIRLSIQPFLVLAGKRSHKWGLLPDFLTCGICKKKKTVKSNCLWIETVKGNVMTQTLSAATDSQSGHSLLDIHLVMWRGET